MYLPFYVKNQERTLMACGLRIEGSPDATAWGEIVSTVLHMAQEQCGAEFVAAGRINNTASTGGTDA